MTYKLIRRLGERFWVEAYCKTPEEAEQALEDVMRHRGHLFKDGTMFSVEYYKFMGYISDNKITIPKIRVKKK